MEDLLAYIYSLDFSSMKDSDEKKIKIILEGMVSKIASDLSLDGDKKAFLRDFIMQYDCQRILELKEGDFKDFINFVKNCILKVNKQFDPLNSSITDTMAIMKEFSSNVSGGDDVVNFNVEFETNMLMNSVRSFLETQGIKYDSEELEKIVKVSLESILQHGFVESREMVISSVCSHVNAILYDAVTDNHSLADEQSFSGPSR